MTVAIFGGSGGLGKKVSEALEGYKITSLSSKDLDIRSYDKCKEFFDSNEIDVVINLAGVNHDKFIHKLGKQDEYMINYILEVNLRGSVNIAAACLPGMRDRGYGRLIYISSVLATKIVPGTALYSSCKAFIDRFVKSASAENISKGVTVNSIQLGYFDGGLTYKLPNPDEIKNSLPLKRWGTAKELVKTIEYFIQNEYATGMNLQLNGGA